MGTMKTLMDAPETSPLAMVNMEDIGLFYIQLTRYPLTIHHFTQELILLNFFGVRKSTLRVESPKWLHSGRRLKPSPQILDYGGSEVASIPAYLSDRR